MHYPAVCDSVSSAIFPFITPSSTVPTSPALVHSELNSWCHGRRSANDAGQDGSLSGKVSAAEEERELEEEEERE
ncbi:hypothetical protein E2C01_012038 [Portunus trituberculatus]|uniref:Uncharacterized protein n=1 Tax=Portunus trituberculatus TaxID=210409 RepID=A0A5B7DCS3_PORTR|nr:hypothetical protein [Portunus trituberculatus]